VKNHIKEGQRNFLLNFGKIEFMDSMGVGELLASYKSIHDLGGKLKLLKLPPRIQLVFDITGITRLFELFDDEEEAIRSFS
jgi:anti-anti-sigma factor